MFSINLIEKYKIAKKLTPNYNVLVCITHVQKLFKP